MFCDLFSILGLAEKKTLDYTRAMFAPKNPLLLSKAQPHIEEAAQKMLQFFSSKGYSVPCLDANSSGADLIEAAKGKDLLIVLGGDGTLVHVARNTQSLSLPLMPFNFGRVGFLAEWSPSTWEENLSSLIQGELVLQEHAGISWDYSQGGEILRQGFAVNDIVLSRGQLARVVPISLSFNGEYVASVRSDGLIVSTPLGASGYSFSAGASLVHPSLEVLCLASIAPLQQGFSSMIVPHDTQIELCLSENLRFADKDLFVTVDGQEGFEFQENGQITVTLARKALRFVSLNKDTYISRLQNRNFI